MATSLAETHLAPAPPKRPALTPVRRPARAPFAPRPTTPGTPTPGPIVKWVGGKGRILTQLLPLLPAGVERMRHVEPFAGGAAMFFARQPARALLSDVNPALIDTYLAVRDRCEDVITHLSLLVPQHDKDFYYECRHRYNHVSLPDPERAALFIYLNKTCFNGLHRVNRKGHFNVPAGSYRRPKILDAEGLRAASRQLQKTRLSNTGFEAMLKEVRPGDFVYFDPPYAPLSRTANFTSYAEGGFGAEDQARLRDTFKELTRRGSRCMLSNSDVPLIRDLYRGFRIDTVAAPRAINCKGNRRGLVSELVIRNYR